MANRVGSLFRLGLFLIFFLLNIVCLYAQTGGSTSGALLLSVKDNTGAVVAGAEVKVTQLETNFVRNSLSQEDGSCSFISLPPGDYQLEIVAEGFNSRSQALRLNVGVTALAEFKLSPTGTQEVIEVKATNGLGINTESSNNIVQDKILSLPINLRDFLGFALTSARVVQDRVSLDSTLAASGLSFNGQSARFNNVTIDGLDNNELGSGNTRSTFSQEAVQEFQVLSDSYSAEFGRALGGVVNIVTRSGSNQLHGSLFYLFRGDEISARDTFSPNKLPFRQHQFGATISGPIKRDRIYFFNAFERRSVQQNKLVTISDAVVSAAQRQGFPITTGPAPFAIGLTTVLSRIDAKLSNNDNFWIRYNGGFNYDGAFESFGGLRSDTVGGIKRLKDNSIALNNTYISTKFNLVNESRFIFNRFNQKVDPISNFVQVSIAAPEGTVLFGTNRVLPQPRRLDTYQFVNNVSMDRGKNQIKFGIDFASKSTFASLPLFNTGFAVFTPIDFGALSGNPAFPKFTALEAFDPTLRSPAQQSFLLLVAASLPTFGLPVLPLDKMGIPAAFIQGFGNTNTKDNTKLFSAFFQDDIKVRPNLLVKAGLRYDIGRYSFLPKNNGNFSPRLALAYRPNNSERISLHAAYGIFFGVQLSGPSLAAKQFSSKVQNLFTLPFPSSLLPYSLPGRAFPQSNDLPSGVNFIPQLGQNLVNQPDIRNSYTHQVTAGFDYYLNKDTALSIDYNYVRGIKLFSIRSINPVVRPIPGDFMNSVVTGRVDPTQGDVFEFESAFDSYFNGLTISLERRFTSKMGLTAHYTYSKAIDNFVDFRGEFQEANDSLKPGGERGLSLQDVRNRFVLSGLWSLDYTKNILLKGFKLSTIISLESGRPYNLLAGVDLNMNGDQPPGDRPNGIARNAGVTRGFSSLDFRLQRTFNINESCRLEATLEVFNLLNRVNFNSSADNTNRIFLPNAQGIFNLPPQEDGRFTLPRDRYLAAFAPRQLQFGFKFSF